MSEWERQKESQSNPWTAHPQCCGGCVAAAPAVLRCRLHLLLPLRMVSAAAAQRVSSQDGHSPQQAGQLRDHYDAERCPQPMLDLQQQQQLSRKQPSPPLPDSHHYRQY